MRFSGEQYVYKFSEGDASMRNLLGGKGAGVAEMTKLGMPVPEGFTVSTEACVRYFADGGKVDDEIKSQIFDSLSEMQESLGKWLGDPENPLLVSVRSGARVSMPGMMDTILNLGLNEDVVRSLVEKTGNARWAWDSYRRFIQMYSDVVMGLDKACFEGALDELKRERGAEQDTDLTAEDLEGLVRLFLDEYRRQVGRSFPTDPIEQLMEAVQAVFRSWDNPRAIYFRRMNSIPDTWGTAVTVQRMVFGNMSADSGTGVAFSRNPSTGEKGLFGEYLMNAQGEDVVAGIRTPQAISHLKEQNPAVYEQFTHIVDKLELYYRDMQDMEFTIEEGKLYMLQTRNGKRTPQAAFRIASDFVDEGILTQEGAVCSVDPKYITALLHPQFDAKALASGTVLGTGLPASPGSRHRACGVQRRGRGRMDQARRTGDSRPPRHHARRHRRHALRTGRAHRSWRHDQPCGRSGPRHRPLLRVRSVRHRIRTGRDGSYHRLRDRRHARGRRRLDLPGRQCRQGVRRAHCHCAGLYLRRIRPSDGLG